MSSQLAANGSDMPAVTVVSVSWYSARHLARLVANLRATAHRPERLRFLIVDNTAGSDRTVAQLADRAIEVVSLDPGPRRGSWGHAHALDAAFARIETPRALLTDPDVHVFLGGWDVRFAAALDPPGTIAIGAPYPWWKLGKYHDFPSPVFALVDVAAVRALGAGWQPFPRAPRKRLGNFLGRQLVRLGLVASRQRLVRRPRLARLACAIETQLGVVAPDTGWEIAAAARRAGRAAVCLRVATTDDPAIAGLPAARDLAREYELFLHDDRPALVHMYSTRGYLWRTARGGDEDYFADRVAAHEAELAGVQA